MAGSKSWQERLWRRAGLHALGFKMEEYDRYLETPHWQTFRRRALDEQLRTHGRNFCVNCPPGSPTPKAVDLHVHHLTYERLGREQLEDVTIICRACHEVEHGHDARGKGRNYAPGYRG